MKTSYLFPGQGSQFPGMGKDLYESHAEAKSMFERANEILGFRITELMFNGTEEDLKQTKVTQPSIFLHSVILAHTMGDSFRPDMVAGHSLGEFSALVANKTLTFEDGLRLVKSRAFAMQKACEIVPSTMAAILNLDDNVVKGINDACEKMKAAGAKRALVLSVGGAFHSPFMEPAREELAGAIANTQFSNPVCAVYQNVNARAVTDPEEIKRNLISQLTAPVRWTQTIQNMIGDGATNFIEVGPGKVLQGLVKKINKDMEAMSALL
jgi:[acyl-carrier-protein] S-malonyltransferase